MHITTAIDASSHRGIHIQEEVLEIYIMTTLQQGGYRVVLLTFYMQLHRGKEPAECWLVDDFLFILCHGGIAQYGELLQQLFVVSAGI